MKSIFNLRRVALTAMAVAALVAGTNAQAQIYKIHEAEIAASAEGRYVTPISGENSNTPWASEGLGVLVNVREQPKSWFGLEANYSYNEYNEHYNYVGGSTPVPVAQNEATLGYVLHLKSRWGIQPFVVLGGGAVDFLPTRGATGPNQWRGAGMYEVGFDYMLKANPHVGFRIQQHGLLYKAPDFYENLIRSNTWVHHSGPAVGLVYRF